MFLKTPMKAAAWLLLALGLAACSATSSPPGEEEQAAANSPQEAAQEPLTEPLPAEDKPATATQPPTATAPPTAPPPPTATTLPAASLPDLGPAPDITNQIWLNSDQPLNLAALRGRVVVVEFWTFG